MTDSYRTYVAGRESPRHGLAKVVDHAWPWWEFGIGLGLLTLFGLFERKRNETLCLLGELKSWER